MKINLALAGCGQLYVAMVGVLMALKDFGVEVVGVSATSGGAIIAGGLASGYKPDEMLQLVKKTLPSKTKVLDTSWINLFKNKGLSKGTKIEEVFAKYFVKTLGETKIPTYISTTGMFSQQQNMFNTHNHPDLSLMRAIRASISLPLLFEPVEIGDTLYWEGGLTNNLPVDVFKNSPYPTLGVRFTSPHAFHAKRTLKDVSLKEIIFLVIETLVSALEAAKTDGINVLNIKTTYNSLNFKITETDVDIMVKQSYSETMKWLDEHKKVFKV